MTIWKIKAWKQEQNKLAYKIELFILHITHINTFIRSLMKLIYTNIESGTFTHLSTYRINHRNSFILSCRKAYPTSPLPRRQAIIYTALFQMKYRISFGSQNTGEEAALERICLKVQEKKKLGCSWYIRRGSARRRHIKRQYQSWRLNPSVKVTLPMAPISASTGGRIAWHCPVTSTQKHGALERVSQLSTPHFNSL